MVISAEIPWPDVGDTVYAKTSVHVVDFQVATVTKVSVDSVTVQWNSNSLYDTIYRGIGMIRNAEGGEDQKIWPARGHPIQEPLIPGKLADPTNEMPDGTKTALERLPTEFTCDNLGCQSHCDATAGPEESILQTESSYNTSLMADLALPLNPVVSNGPVNRNQHSILPISADKLAMISSNSSNSAQSKTKGDSVEVVEMMSSSHTKERLTTCSNEGNISNLETLGPLHHLKHLRFDNFGDVPNINTRLALASPSTKVRKPVTTC